LNSKIKHNSTNN